MRNRRIHQALLALAIAATSWIGSIADAQVTPMGAHHPTGGEGAGLGAGTSPTGGYGASVPLIWPDPRGDIPIPLNVVYTGGTRAGYAGAGFDVPLSYVRLSRQLRGRKPAIDGGGPPERLYLSIDGPMLMVPSDEPGTYVPFSGPAGLRLRRESAGTWVARDSSGRRYTFTSVSPAHTDLWLLTRIDSGGVKDHVVLDYAIDAVCAGDGGATQIRLNRLRYSFDATGQTPLFEIQIEPQEWVVNGQARCLGIDRSDEVPRGHQHLIRWIRVLARNNRLATTGSQKILRQYNFEYGPDRDSDLPRLAKVRVSGQGAAGDLPVVSYEYGSALENGELVFDSTIAVPRNFDGQNQYVPALSSSRTTRTTLSGFYNGQIVPLVEKTEMRTVHAIRDMTGDGLPDLVFEKGGRLFMVANVTSPSGSRLDGTPVDIAAPFPYLGLEVTRRPVHASQAANMVVTETWVQLADVNGDGRLDIIDALGGMNDQYWRVFLNFPHPVLGPRAIQWRTQQVYIDSLRAWLDHNAHQIDLPMPGGQGRRLPITRTRTGSESLEARCLDATFAENLGTGNGAVWGYTGHTECESAPDPFTGFVQTDRTLAAHTITEWNLGDFNSDGYPDFASNDQPVLLTNNEGVACDGDVMCSPDGVGDLVEQLPNDALFEYCEDGQGEDIRICHYHCECTPRTAPRLAEDANHVSVLYNHGGALFRTAGARVGDIFPGQPVRLSEADGTCGLEWWVSRDSSLDPDDPSTVPDLLDPYFGFYEGRTWQRCGFIDLNDDKVLEYVRGSGQAYESDRHEVCDEGSSDSDTFITEQTAGLIDITGDGIADWVRLVPGSPGWWNVQPGDGTGRFGPNTVIDAPDFALSRSVGTCGGTAYSTAGVLDIDGDGVPEAARIDLDPTTMTVQLLADRVSAPGGRAAIGRLVGIGNGWGGFTRLIWSSAKEDTTTLHQVPFPEIVVSSTRVDIASGAQGPGLDPTLYAYGDAELTYDPLLGRFTFAGYRRSVSLSGLAGSVTGGPNQGVTGIAVITDAVPSGSGHAGIALAGRPERIWRLEGFFQPDPRALLAIDPDADGRTRANAINEHAIAPVASSLVPPAGSDCFEADPVTNNFPIGDTSICQRAGVPYTSRADIWGGTAAPPSDQNIQSAFEVTAVDTLGRITGLRRHNDTRRLDDDICIAIDYSAPLNSADRGISNLHSTRVTDCGLGHGDPATLAAARFEYDGLVETPASGTFSVGQMTAAITERYVPQTGAFLGEQIDGRLTHELTFGQVASITRQRTVPTAATGRSLVDYDPWGLTPTRLRGTGTSALTLTRTLASSVIPNDAFRVVEPNGEEAFTCRDIHGRVIREGRRAGSTQVVLRTITFVENQSTQERSIIAREFDGGAPAPAGICSEPDSSLQAHAHTFAETRLDALGRPMFTQVGLGSDYDNTWLVAGYVERDRLGRITFAADAFEHSEYPFVPESLETAPFGTTSFYDAGSRVVGQVAATGPQAGLPTFTSDANRVYVSRQYLLYLNGQAVVRRQGPAELELGNASFGASNDTYMTATGRLDGEGRYQAGQWIEWTDYDYDRLGQRTRTTRYRQPNTAAQPVVWESVVDSLGQELELREPANAPALRTFNEWGMVYDTRWTDGTTLRRVRIDSDGFGRIKRERRYAGATVESDVSYFYDQASTSPDHLGATNLRGRLAYVQAAGAMNTYFGYGPFGDVATASRVGAGQTSRFVTYSDRDAAGVLRHMRLDSPTTSEDASYQYDSAGRLARVDLSGTAGTMAPFLATDIDALGRYRELALGNGVIERYTYEADGLRRLKRQQIDTAQERWQRDLDAYDGAGRLLSVRERRFPTGQFPTTRRKDYTYDGSGRMASAQLSDPFGLNVLEHETFTYDGLGNLLRRQNELNGQIKSFVAHTVDLDRLCAVTGSALNPDNPPPTPCTHTYDAAGNTKQIAYGTDVRTFTYDAGSRLTTQTRSDGTLARFSYDGLGGMALLELSQAALIRRERNYGGLMSEVFTVADGQTRIARRIPGPAGMSVELRGTGANAQVVYAHADDTANRLFTDRTGTIVQRVDYGPYGETRTDTGTPGTIGYSFDQWNGGQRLRELGTTILGARGYDPDTGRFLSRDPIRHDLGASRSHPYSFAFNDPVNYTDPSGLSPFLFITKSLGQPEQSSPIPMLAGNVALSMINFIDHYGGVEAPAAPPVGPDYDEIQRAAAATEEVLNIVTAQMARGARDDIIAEITRRALRDPSVYGYEMVRDELTSILDDLDSAITAAQEGDIETAYLKLESFQGKTQFLVLSNMSAFVGAVKYLRGIRQGAAIAGRAGQIAQTEVRVVKALDEAFDSARTSLRISSGMPKAPPATITDPARMLKSGISIPNGNLRSGMEHILREHGFNTITRTPASKFGRGMGHIEIRELIDEAVGRSGAWRVEGNSRVLDTHMGRIIGTDMAGNPAQSLRVVTDIHGAVITAYPIP